MLVQSGLCQTCSETTLLVFPRGGSNATLILRIREIIVNYLSLSKGMIQAAVGKSLPELAQATSKTLAQSNRNMEEGQQPSAGEKKAKRGFLSMLGKKDKKQKLVSMVQV